MSISKFMNNILEEGTGEGLMAAKKESEQHTLLTTAYTLLSLVACCFFSGPAAGFASRCDTRLNKQGDKTYTLGRRREN